MNSPNMTSNCNVFVSYSRQDIEVARSIRNALRAERFQIWWDEDLYAGDSWREKIDEALMAAAVVLVLWSRHSVESDWVKHEASIAKARGILAHARLDDITVPGIFDSMQAEDLTTWNGNEEEIGFRKLVKAINSIQAKKRKRRERLNAVLLWLCTSVAIIGVAGVVWYHFALADMNERYETLKDTFDAQQQILYEVSAKQGGKLVYLNDRNISLSLGAATTARIDGPEWAGPFSHRSTQDSLVSAIDAPSADSSEKHTATTHVWAIGTLELAFDFRQPYKLKTLHFWNYFNEGFDVDIIDFKFFDAKKAKVADLIVEPALGKKNDDDLMFAEHINLNIPHGVQYVSAVLTSSNKMIDFGNIGFIGSPVCEPL